MLKVGASIMMLKNMDYTVELYNDTHLLIDHLGDRIIQAPALPGSNIGYKGFILRITLTFSNGSKISIVLEDSFLYLCVL